METGVLFAGIPNNDPRLRLFNVIERRECLPGTLRRNLEAYGTHVVIVTVVDVGLVWISKTLLQIQQRLISTYLGSRMFSMHFVADSRAALSFEMQIKKSEPLDQRVVSRKFAKIYVRVRWLYSAHFQSFLDTDRPMSASRIAQRRKEEIPARGQTGNAALLWVLRPCHTKPTIFVEDFALRHFPRCYG